MIKGTFSTCGSWLKLLLLQVKDLSKSFGIDQVFSNVSLQIHSGEKVGMVGPNGAGKTTLLRCITKEETPDQGEISFKDKLSTGYLQQLPEYPGGVTLFDAVIESFADLLALRARLRSLEKAMGRAGEAELTAIMEKYSAVTEEYERAGGFACEATVRKITAGLGFTEAELGREVNSFSGGEKTRAGLARLLTREPELLLLDEPTNHLDLQAVEWLEGYLKGYSGAVLLISHDRYFLDQVTTKTLELAHGRLSSYAGNYSRYLSIKEQQVFAETRAYEKQQQEIKATEEYIAKYHAGIKSKQARGRQSQLNRLERLNAPQHQETIHIRKGDMAASGNVVLTVEDLDFAFNEAQLLSQVNLQINKGEKVALIGPNGAGKSTFLKILLGEYKAQNGSIRLGSRIRVAYYDQEHSGLDVRNRVIDELVHNLDLTENEARNYLGAFLFHGDDVFKSVGDLSGGEKGRLSFLKLLLSDANFLILDEPTNHLDMPSKEIIEGYLQEFAGTTLIVSHDRYFLDKTVNRTLELAGGKITSFAGNYTYYRERKAQLQEAQQRKVQEKPAVVKETPRINKSRTRQQITQLEADIEQMEERTRELSELLAAPETYQKAEASDLVAEYRSLEEKIAAAYAEWESLNELLAQS